MNPLTKAAVYVVERDAEKREKKYADYTGTTLIYSDRDGLEYLSAYMDRRDRVDTAFPPSFPIRALRRLLRARSVNGVRRSVVFAYQRLRMGWDERSVWSLDSWLTKTLGQQLTYMASIAHGNPTWTTYDEWVKALDDNGRALLRYAQDLDDEAALVEAQQALHWVADNLASLWD